jgi:hypothetical protein
MPRYAATAGAGVLSGLPPRTFAVEAARDARPGLRPGSKIAQFGDNPSGEFDAIPSPARLLQDVFSAELGAAGHRPSAENPDVRIVPEMRRFEAGPGGTFFHSNVSAAVEVSVKLEGLGQAARSRDYSAQCTKDTTWSFTISAGLLSRLFADCLKQIGVQFRQDGAVRDFLNSTSPRR